jgi:hypothetical protein
MSGQPGRQLAAGPRAALPEHQLKLLAVGQRQVFALGRMSAMIEIYQPRAAHRTVGDDVY